MNPKQLPISAVFTVQVVVVAAFAVSYATGSPDTRRLAINELTGSSVMAPLAIPRQTPLIIEPLYDDRDVVNDEELASVLAKVQPRFWSKENPEKPMPGLKPNYVEHALRTWWIKARFQDPRMMSGEALKDYLVDHEFQTDSDFSSFHNSGHCRRGICRFVCNRFTGHASPGDQ